MAVFFAAFDEPAARLAILLWLPWAVESTSSATCTHTRLIFGIRHTLPNSTKRPVAPPNGMRTTGPLKIRTYARETCIIFIDTHIVSLRKQIRDTQNIAQVKYEIWLRGGPPTDFQQLFVTGSNVCATDIDKLNDVLPPGATLQLVITKPSSRELSVHAVVCPHYPFASDEFTVPIATDASEPAINDVTADIAYLGHVTVDSTADGSSIALEIQDRFGDMHLDPRMIVFVSTDDFCEGCEGKKGFLETMSHFYNWCNGTSAGV